MTEYATYFETMGRKARVASTAMQLADTYRSRCIGITYSGHFRGQ